MPDAIFGREIDISKLNLVRHDHSKERIFLTVGKFDLTIIHTDEGIVVDVFPARDGYCGDAIATTYAFDSDADEAEDN